MKILYIHGFGSTFKSSKTEELSKHFEVVGFNLTNKPKQDIEMLKEFYKQERPDVILGTSLGAFYSYYLSSIFDAYCVLINPITTPSEQLKYHLGTNISYADGKGFEFTQDDLNALLVLEEDIKNIDKLHILTTVYYANKDTKLNIQDIKEKYKYCKLNEFNSTSHRFEEEFGSVIQGLLQWENSNHF